MEGERSQVEGSYHLWRGAIAGGGEVSQVKGRWRQVEKRVSRWREAVSAIAGGGEQLQVEEKCLTLRGAVSGGLELSHVEGSDRRWRGAVSGEGSGLMWRGAVEGAVSCGGERRRRREFAGGGKCLW